MRESDVRRLVDALRAGGAVEAPSDALVAFAAVARRLGPHALVTEARALEKTEDPTLLARIVVGRLRATLSDIDEHGAQAEHADGEKAARAALAGWQKRAGDHVPWDVLVADDLEDTLVAVVEHMDLPAAEKASWKALRASRKLAPALKKLKAPLTPWFAELAAAYVAREVRSLALPRGSSWQASVDDVPALLDALADPLGMPPVFSPRALRAANRLVLRHGHDKTRERLAALGALRGSAEDAQRVARETRTADVMRLATETTRARKTKSPHQGGGSAPSKKTSTKISKR